MEEGQLIQLLQDRIRLVKAENVELEEIGTVVASVVVPDGTVYALGSFSPMATVKAVKQKLAEVSEMVFGSQMMYLTDDIRSLDDLEIKDHETMHRVKLYQGQTGALQFGVVMRGRTVCKQIFEGKFQQKPAFADDGTLIIPMESEWQIMRIPDGSADTPKVDVLASFPDPSDLVLRLQLALIHTANTNDESDLQPRGVAVFADGSICVVGHGAEETKSRASARVLKLSSMSSKPSLQLLHTYPRGPIPMDRKLQLFGLCGCTVIPTTQEVATASMNSNAVSYPCTNHGFLYQLIFGDTSALTLFLPRRAWPRSTSLRPSWCWLLLSLRLEGPRTWPRCPPVILLFLFFIMVSLPFTTRLDTGCMSSEVGWYSVHRALR
jgi:hypothetical protein